MDIKMNFCPSGGYLVGAQDWLPSSPFSQDFGGPGVFTGCNQLRCEDCGAAVRSVQGWDSAAQIELSSDELFEAQDWAKVPGLVRGQKTLYACRCDHRFIGLSIATDHLAEMENETGPDSPNWACGGHPAFRLPGEVDGRWLENENDVTQFLEEILAGAWKKSHPNPVRNGYPGFLLWRLYARVRDTGLGTMVSHRVRESLVSESPDVRVVAIAFFKVFPLAPGADRLAEIYRSNVSCFAGVPDPILGLQDLGLHYELALQARAERTYDPEALEIIRENMMRNAPLSGQRFHLIQQIDRVWLEDHRDEVLRAAPQLIDHWVRMVRAWPEEILLQELHAIKRETPLPRQRLLQAVRKQLQDHPRKLERIAARL